MVFPSGFGVWVSADAQRGQTQNSILELTSTHCLAYLDDIIIWAPSLEEHLHRLRLLFDRIPTAALKLKPT